VQTHNPYNIHEAQPVAKYLYVTGCIIYAEGKRRL